MKFTFTRWALLAAVALSLVAATVGVVKKTSDYPRVTTPGTNDLFLLAVPNPTNGLFGTGSTNKAVTYANLKASINATNQPPSANLSNWSALATSAKQDALGYTPQPASANLTNWSALATSAKQDTGVANNLIATQWVRFPFTNLTITGTNVAAPDLSAATHFKLTLTTNAFFGAPTGLPGTNLAQTIQVHLIQDSTGGWTVTLTNSAWVLSGSGTSTNAVASITTNANAVSILTFVSSPFDATKLYGVPTPF